MLRRVAAGAVVGGVCHGLLGFLNATDENGNPLTDVTDEFGNYLFDGLQPGEYVVKFVLPDGFSLTTTITVAMSPSMITG